MALSPFLVVLGRDDRGAGTCWRRWWSSGRWYGVWIRRGHYVLVRDALKDGHESGDDDDDGPATSPGEDVKGVQQEEDADEGDPDRAAEGAEEPVLIAGGAVVGEACAGVGHPADKEPDAEPDEKEGNDAVNGKGVKPPRVADEEEAA
jgi:hypothetical protein